MISKLKRKFTLLATVSMLALMTLLVGIMNIINYSTVVSEADNILDVISQPNAPFMDKGQRPDRPKREIEEFIPHGMSPEVPYESRFFVAKVFKNGDQNQVDITNIISVDDSEAAAYVDKALNSGKLRGFLGQFRYLKTEDSNVTRIVFLDCGRKLDAFNRFLLISVLSGLFGCVLVFFVFCFAAGKIVRPIAESYEKQKRFITDAGHEIKTPLTIINANVDLMELDYGEQESLNEIKLQTTRLSELTAELVYLSKMEENENLAQKIEFPISDLIQETVNPFQALATAQNKNLRVDIASGLTANGVPDAIRRLASVLLENAMKYSPEGGIVTVSLKEQKKNIVFTVFNTTSNKIDQDSLPHLFERFYRADASRNSETGGSGLGLSIAKAIVDGHGGTITAETRNSDDLTVTVVLPM